MGPEWQYPSLPYAVSLGPPATHFLRRIAHNQFSVCPGFFLVRLEFCFLDFVFSFFLHENYLILIVYFSVNNFPFHGSTGLINN